MQFKLPVLLILGIWLGMLLGISFLEAPLKFKAPNMTLVLGLGVGKVVFGALNKVELLFSAILFTWLILFSKHLSTWLIINACILVGVILLQSIWLLPILDAHVDAMLQGTEVKHSHHHVYYIVMEILKVGLLLTTFVKLYNYEGY